MQFLQCSPSVLVDPIMGKIKYIKGLNRLWNLLTLSQTTILDSSTLKEFVVDNFEFDEDGKKLSKQAENTEGKGEIACYEQFLLFPQCFQTTCTADTLKPGLVWERVNVGYRK